MPFDYKKEYRAFYQPPKVPEIIDVPEMQFVCLSGTGDPNEEGGAYQQALGVLYAVSYTLKMSPRAGHLMDGFFRLRRAAAGRLLAAGRRIRHGLRAQGGFALAIRDSRTGFRDGGGFPLGGGNGVRKEEAGLLPR